MKDYTREHSFVICAYKESPYLEACIRGLRAQTSKSAIKMVTSTPNKHIQSLAEKYNIPLVINTGKAGMVRDWNFGMSQCSTPYVTIAHQDDLYFPKYVEVAMRELYKRERPLIFFSDYVEIREGKLVEKNLLLQIKRGMLFLLKGKCMQKSIFLRRRILSFGNPISCPTVTYAIDNLPYPLFSERFRSDQDWEAWERISRLPGEFVYCDKRLMGHRIHAESETSAMISESLRNKEDYQMFCKFWPSWLAKLLAKGYAISEHNNIT